MSTAPLRPRRYLRLLQADLRNVARDPTLAVAVVMSMIPGMAFILWQDQLETFGRESFGLDDLARHALPIVLCIPALLIGWVAGFLLLEERDDGPLLAIDVTPLGKSGLMTYRLFAAMAATACITLSVTLLALPEAGWILAGLITLLIALETAAVALILPALARNKVEGLALTKVINIAALVPYAAIFASPLRYIAGLVPTYWIGELLLPSAMPPLALAVLVPVALISHVGAVVLCFWLLHRRAG